MKLNSKYFDGIRIKGKGNKPEPETIVCEWPDCEATGNYRAPKGRNAEGQYFRFCAAHVKEYNKSYNYFDGMADNDIGAWIKASQTGHRPTWKLGENSWAENKRARAAKKGGKAKGAGFKQDPDMNDPHRLFEEHAASRGGTRSRASVGNAQRKALDTLGLDPGVTGEEIKAQYKMLVKRFHPDANGGSRETEDRLREIITAYNYLKDAGVC
jgi:hypothetical protein